MSSSSIIITPTTKPLASTFYTIFFFLSLLSVHISAHNSISHKSNSKSCNNNNFATTPPCQKPPLKIEASSPTPTPISSQNGLVFSDKRLELVYPVIQKFKSTITSDPLGITKTWVGSDICNYKGFFCDTPPYNNSAIALASIDFNGFQISAPTLDDFIDNLPDIALFHANSNNFGGTITPKISKLPYLYELDLSNNNLSGPFPLAVLGMETLTFLDIRFNSFSGSVPPQIFDQNLEVLFINNNFFTQGLPENLGRTQILLLTLANNKFMGPIPATLPKALSKLTEVLFLNNQLTGCLPYEIGYLEDARVFDAGENQLTGPLPLSLSCLVNLEVLNFGGNLLYGIVPEIVCASLENSLVNFSLADNYFTHVGPFCRVLIQKGVLDVSNNCIPDLPFQRSIVDCANFFAQPRLCPFMWYHSFIPCKLPFP